MEYMNSFCETLKNAYPNFITQQQFETALKDEEFLSEEGLSSCFACCEMNMQNPLAFYTINGSFNIFKYIEKKLNMYKAFVPQSSEYMFKMHFLEYARLWLYDAGFIEETVPRFDKQDSMNIKAIICQQCGTILGFILNGITVYPYFGYRDNLTEIAEEFSSDTNKQIAFRNHVSENKNIIKEDIEEIDLKNIKEINKNFNINNYKTDLLEKLNKNKEELNNLVKRNEKDSYEYLPLLHDILRKIEALNDIL